MTTIGFDLDLTLADSGDGIVATTQLACERVGVLAEPDAVRPMIGLPLSVMLGRLVTPEAVEEAVRMYRELYPTLGVPATKPLPGAVEAIAAVHQHGMQAIVVTTKIVSAGRQVVDQIGLPVDDVIGDRHGETKGDVLRERGALAYVGDHPADMRGARSVGVHAVGVTTGPHDVVALRDAGADVVLPDLLAFPSWLDEFMDVT